MSAGPKADAALEAWQAARPAPKVTISDVTDHIDHIAKITGVDHVGLGSDIDGESSAFPDGLSGADAYPDLLSELMRRGWSDVDVAAVASGNVLRVTDAPERVAA